MGKKYIFIAVFVSFSILSAAQIPVLSIKKNIFKMDSVFEKEAISKSQYFIKSTPLPSIVQEVSKLLLKYPNLNSFYLDGQQAFYTKVNIGFALDDGSNGLKVASIIDVDSLTLNSIEENISDLSLKYSNNQLNILELTSATFTITDLFNSNIIVDVPNLSNIAIEDPEFNSASISSSNLNSAGA